MMQAGYNAFVSTVTAGMVAGTVVGAVGSAIYGGSPLTGALTGGLTGAAMAALMFGVGEALQRLQQSPALEGTGGPPDWRGPRLAPSVRPEGLPQAKSMPMSEDDGFTINNEYRQGHGAIDGRSPGGSYRGQVQYSTGDGIVTGIGQGRHGINWLTVNTEGVTVLYMHCTPLSGITVNTPVADGQAIAFLDSSGATAQPKLWFGWHVHMQTSFNGNWFNPRFYLGR